MKIGNAIRAVLEKHPEIRRRRAQLNAIGYLFKRDEKVTIRWYSFEKSISVATNLNTSISMKSLSEYFRGEQVMLVMKDGKLEVAP